jgi:hypothetical protein
MNLDNPSARIRETKAVLERLEKRLEKYYPPDAESTVKHTDLVKQYKSKFDDRLERYANLPK